MTKGGILNNFLTNIGFSPDDNKDENSSLSSENSQKIKRKERGRRTPSPKKPRLPASANPWPKHRSSSVFMPIKNKDTLSPENSENENAEKSEGENSQCSYDKNDIDAR